MILLYILLAARVSVPDFSSFVQAKPQEIICLFPEMPTYPGGDAALNKYLRKTIHVPEWIVQQGISTTTFVKFTVDHKGNIGNVVTVRSSHTAFDTIAMNVVRKMPKWNPARQDGKPVTSTMVLPIRVCLREE